MLFKNNGKQDRVRKEYIKNYGWKWVYVSHGETIDLSEEIGKGYGFDKVEKPKAKEGRHGKKKIETKFKEKLTEIDGIGKKVADDLLEIYPDEDKLREAVRKGEQIPIRNDLAKKVEKKFK